jgi:hypothetical protein
MAQCHKELVYLPPFVFLVPNTLRKLALIIFDASILPQKPSLKRSRIHPEVYYTFLTLFSHRTTPSFSPGMSFSRIMRPTHFAAALSTVYTYFHKGASCDDDDSSISLPSSLSPPPTSYPFHGLPPTRPTPPFPPPSDFFQHPNLPTLPQSSSQDPPFSLHISISDLNPLASSLKRSHGSMMAAPFSTEGDGGDEGHGDMDTTMQTEGTEKKVSQCRGVTRSTLKTLT